MKKFKLNAVAAIAASVAAGSSFAVVDIDAGTGTVTVAKEIIASASSAVTLTNLASALDIKSAVGYALSSGEVRYVRVELANGIFKTASATATNGSVGAINGVGTSVVYFSITAPAGGILATDTITLAGTRDITGTASNMTVSYSVYDQPSQAQAGGSTGRIVNKDGKAYINFAKSYTVALTADSAVADVEASPAFTKFAAGQTSGLTSTARLASLDYKLPTTVPIKADGNPIALTDIMATGSTGTKLTITGDFTAAANANGTYTGAALATVYLATAATCPSAGAINASAVSATAATFNVGATANTPNIHLCYAPLSTNAIPASTYSGTLSAVSANTAVYSVDSTTLASVSEITRNGTELQAPLVQTTTGYVSRFFLTNTGNAAAPVSVAVQGETGNTITKGTLSFTIPANGSLEIPAASVITATSGAPRATAVFSIARPTKQIQGVYQITNPASGATAMIPMLRPGTN